MSSARGIVVSVLGMLRPRALQAGLVPIVFVCLALFLPPGVKTQSGKIMIKNYFHVALLSISTVYNSRS